MEGEQSENCGIGRATLSYAEFSSVLVPFILEVHHHKLDPLYAIFWYTHPVYVIKIL